jgi:phosphoribosylglycinamide formyltransferase-1
MKLGILISGRGSNMVSLAEACARDDFPATVAVVVANVPGAGGLERAEALGIPTAVVDHRDYSSREEFELALIEVLRRHEVQAVCLAGFMRIVTSTLLEAFPERVLNIHPSLLPAFPGAHAHRDVLAHGAKVSGCTVHLVNEGMDSGPILLQAAVPVADTDSEETLAARVLEQEHLIFPQAVRLLAEDRLRICGRRVQIVED